jgi:hypothetical protein
MTATAQIARPRAPHTITLSSFRTGVPRRICGALHAEVRQLEGKSGTPTLAMVDSQTVKSAEKGAKD